MLWKLKYSQNYSSNDVLEVNDIDKPGCLVIKSFAWPARGSARHSESSVFTFLS